MKARAWAWWVFTRALAFAIWLGVKTNQNDVRYYYASIADLATNGPAATLVEYPTPVIWVLQLPYLTGLGSLEGYVISFVAAMVLLDFTFTWYLARRGYLVAMVFWTSALALMLPTAYLRFDLVTTLLAAWALFALGRNLRALGAGLTAVGASLKLWPALLWPALLVENRKRNWFTTAWFWGIGVALAVAALAYGGWARLFTPLTWQSERGLQIESVWASVPMLSRAFRPGEFTVALSPYQAFEIAGPGVAAWFTVSNIATVLGLLAILVTYVFWLRSPRTVAHASLLVTLVVAITIVTNKTFSPQYLLWLLGPIAVGLALATDDRVRQVLNRLALTVVTLMALTLVVYPIGYASLLEFGGLATVVTAVLVLRNVGLLVMTGWLAYQLIAILRHGETRNHHGDDVRHET